jgi:hypothetical protein
MQISTGIYWLLCSGLSGIISFLILLKIRVEDKWIFNVLMVMFVSSFIIFSSFCGASFIGYPYESTTVDIVPCEIVYLKEGTVIAVYGDKYETANNPIIRNVSTNNIRIREVRAKNIFGHEAVLSPEIVVID